MADKHLKIPVADTAASLSPEDLAAVIADRKIVKDWVAACEAEARRRLKNGDEVPGWELGPGQMRRHWIDEEAAKAVMARFGINDPYKTPELKSVRDVEKIVGEDRLASLKDEAWSAHETAKTLRPKAAGSGLTDTTEPRSGGPVAPPPHW